MVSNNRRRVVANRAAGAPSTTAWSKLKVNGSSSRSTRMPSTTGRTIPPTVTISVIGDSEVPHPPPAPNIPSEPMPIGGANRAGCGGTRPAFRNANRRITPDTAASASLPVRSPARVTGRVLTDTISAEICSHDLAASCRRMVGIGVDSPSEWPFDGHHGGDVVEQPRRRPTRRALICGCCSTARATVATTNAVNDDRASDRASPWRAAVTSTSINPWIVYCRAGRSRLRIPGAAASTSSTGWRCRGYDDSVTRCVGGIMAVHLARSLGDRLALGRRRCHRAVDLATITGGPRPRGAHRPERRRVIVWICPAERP